MRKSILFSLAAVMVLAMVACGGGGNDANKGNGGTAGGGGDKAADVYALYKKEGRNWTHEMAGGMKMKTTVKKVAEDHAMTEAQMSGADGAAMGDPTETKIEFKTAEAAADASGAKPAEPKKETVKAAGKDWKCVSYDDGKTWMSEEFPGLIVKSESMNLVEFND